MEVVAHARKKAGEPAVFRHDALCAVDEHGQELRSRIGLEDEAGDAPFEIAEGGGVAWALVTACLGEDVYPGVAVGGVGGGSPLAVLPCRGVELVLASYVGWCFGEELDGLGHGGLIEAAVGGVPVTVGRENLSHAEEG